MKYDINNVSGFRIPKKQIDRLFKVVDRFFPSQKRGEISIALVGDRSITQLNKKYRHKNKPTDVLSFPEFSSFEEITSNSYLGEIIISYPIAKKQARQQKHSVSREIIFLLIHGYLHLLGYDHLNKKDEQEMQALESTILKKIY